MSDELHIDISFLHLGQVFKFNADVHKGEIYTFEIGERMLCDKLFYVLVGLDNSFRGNVSGGGINFSAGASNNVLAFGDRNMFATGSVRRNIYMALRARSGRRRARALLREVLGLYDLYKIEKNKIKDLSDEQLVMVALARAHFREIRLVVANCFETYAQNVVNDFTKFKDAYIIKIN